MKRVSKKFVSVLCCVMFASLADASTASSVRVQGNGDNAVQAGNFRVSHYNKDGYAVFKTLPVATTWLSEVGNGNWAYVNMGEFVDLNGDGMADFIVSYLEPNSNNNFYRATFLNDGKCNWVMIACESNVNWPQRFAPCQNTTVAD